VPAPSYLMRRDRILRMMRALPPGQLVEIGCGAGALLDDLARMGHACQAMETSPAARALAEVMLRDRSDIQVHAAPPADWNGRFDYVLAFEVLEHIEDDEGVVQAVARILRPGGAVVISTPIRQALWSPLDEACGHVRRYEPEDLFGLLRRHGLRVEGFVATGGVLRHIDGLRARFLRRNPRAVTAWVQRLVFPTQAWFQRLFGSLRWRSAQDPVPGGADGILVWARKADGEARATRSG
jgi:SAM-dependent methyltransferase